MRARGGILVLFFLSGAVGLVYEIVWTRQLGLVFGVTVFAAAAVLAAFMGGLALGSGLYGRLIDRFASPVRVYAWLEIEVGLSALAMPLFMRGVEPLYLALAGALEGRFVLFNFGRAVLAAIPLLVPTTFMGATVPAMARVLVERRETVGWSVGLLYGINTFGAVAGCVLAGFVLVPYLPLTAILYGAAASNLAIGAVLLAGRLSEPPRPAPDSAAAPPLPAATLGGRGWLALVVFGLSGFAALGYEILWTRTLVLYLPNSTYAFTVMLAAFLCGLALGGVILLRLYDRLARPLLVLGLVEIGVGLSAVAAVAAYRKLPALGVELLGASVLGSWEQSVALMSMRAGLVLLPTTILLGMVFPLLARIVCPTTESLGRRLGGAYALNTAGALAGALGTTFVLIPALGLRGSLVLLSVLSVALGTACVVTGVRRWPTRLAAGSLGAAVAVLSMVAIPETLFSGAFGRGPWKLLFYREGVTDTTAVWEQRGTGERLVTYGDQRGTAGTFTNSLNRRQAHMAHLLHPHPRRSLQIAFGVGNTLAAAALYPEVERLDCVEISPHVRETASYFWTNAGVLDDPKVRLIVDDGRDFLLRTTGRYDVITLEPPEIFTANVVNLYTTEFYRLAYAALAEDGLLSQWIPTYAMGELEMRMLVRSLLEVFPQVSLWDQGRWIELDTGPSTTLLVVGSKRPLRLDLRDLERRMSSLALSEDLRRIEMGTPAAMLSHFIAGTEGVRRWVEGVRPVTDDWTFVDFSSARSPLSRFGFGRARFQEPIAPVEGERGYQTEVRSLYRRLRESVRPLLASDADYRGLEEATGELRRRPASSSPPKRKPSSR